MYDSLWLAIAAREQLKQVPVTRIEMLGSIWGVGRHALARALRVNGDVSYRELQKQCLRSKAESLLQEAPLQSVKEVAFVFGFATPHSFGKLTKWVTGCSPVHWRRKLTTRPGNSYPAGTRFIR
jgi:AraC-like DNA-binding protein